MQFEIPENPLQCLGVARFSLHCNIETPRESLAPCNLSDFAKAQEVLFVKIDYRACQGSLARSRSRHAALDLETVKGYPVSSDGGGSGIMGNPLAEYRKGTESGRVDSLGMGQEGQYQGTPSDCVRLYRCFALDSPSFWGKISPIRQGCMA